MTSSLAPPPANVGVFHHLKCFPPSPGILVLLYWERGVLLPPPPRAGFAFLAQGCHEFREDSALPLEALLTSGIPHKLGHNRLHLLSLS